MKVIKPTPGEDFPRSGNQKWRWFKVGYRTRRKVYVFPAPSLTWESDEKAVGFSIGRWFGKLGIVEVDTEIGKINQVYEKHKSKK